LLVKKQAEAATHAGKTDAKQ